MKRVLLLAAVLLPVAAASAQDIIVKQNGEEIKAKVEEVGEQAIRYRKFTNPKGPVYSVAREDVFVIRYESGDKDVITPIERPEAQAEALGMQPAAPSQALVAKAIEKTKKLERNKMWEWGVRADAGMSFWSMKDDIASMVGASNSSQVSTSQSPGLGFGLQFFGERYFKKTGEGHFGFGVGYMQMGGATSVSAGGEKLTFKTKFDAVFANIYYGLTPVKNGFSLRIGFRIGVPMGVKARFEATPQLAQGWEQDADLGVYSLDTWHKVPDDLVQSVAVSYVLEYGYKFGHSEVALQWLQNFTSPHTVMGGKPWSLGLNYSYRF